MSYFTFPCATDLASWARDYGLEVTATNDGPCSYGNQWVHLPTHR
jgi:hypothetical protein